MGTPGHCARASEQDGPITDISLLMARCDWFGLTAEQALAVLADIYGAVSNWRSIALGRHVGLSQTELNDFAPAFEHTELEAAKRLLGA